MLICLRFFEVPAISARPYDPENEDIRSILHDVCRQCHGHGEFVVGGFGQERWPVDIGTDLSVLLEQLPDVLQALKAGQETALDFYEQGIQRSITFHAQEAVYIANCASATDWRPNPPVESLAASELVDMLAAVRNVFVDLLSKASPDLIQHQWVEEWVLATG